MLSQVLNSLGRLVNGEVRYFTSLGQACVAQTQDRDAPFSSSSNGKACDRGVNAGRKRRRGRKRHYASVLVETTNKGQSFTTFILTDN